MRVIVAENYDALSDQAADFFAGLIAESPEANVMPATGNTPMGMYRALAARKERGEFNADGIKVFQLNEYCGLARDDYRSLFGWMLRSFIEPLDIPLTNVTRLPGDAANPSAACESFETRVVEAGGIDIAILGLGPNGHLGFNEPPTDQNAPTRLVTLTSESIVSNGPYWGGDQQVPLQAVTAGMTLLLAAKQIILVVSGKNKRNILKQTLKGPVTQDVPSSFLQQAPNVTIITDQDAYRF